MIYEIQPRQEELLEKALTTDIHHKKRTIFLAGTIDNGNSVDWQDEVIQYFKENWKYDDVDLIFFNPRRDNWDDINDSEMEYQIIWELQWQEKCDVHFMNILGTSKSPISLMELGAFRDKRFMYVACPKEFYRFTNVKVFCERYHIRHNYEDTSIRKICSDLEELIKYVINL